MSAETEQPGPRPGLGLWKMLPKLGGLGSACKAAHEAHLGEKNTMYFNKELGRWVEPGKESEAQAHSLAPPPTVPGQGCLQAHPASRRSLAQRYVLQNNLCVAPSRAAGPLLPSPPAQLASACSVFEPPMLPGRLLLPAGPAQEQELPSSGPPSSGSDCSPFFGSRSTTRSSSSSSLAGPDSRTSSCNGASRGTQSGSDLADGLAGSFDLLRSAYGPVDEDESPREQQPIEFAADAHLPAMPAMPSKQEQQSAACPPPPLPCGKQRADHDVLSAMAPSAPDSGQADVAVVAMEATVSQAAGADGSSGAASLNRILSLSLSFAHSDSSAPSSPCGTMPCIAPASPKFIRSHAISCAEDTSPCRGQSFTFPCAVPSNFTFDVPAAAAESAQRPAPSLVRSPASQPQQQQQPQPVLEHQADATPAMTSVAAPTSADTGSAVDEVLQKLKQLRGVLLETAPSGTKPTSADSAGVAAAAAPQLNKTVAEAARALAGLGMLPSPFAAASAEGAITTAVAASESPCSSSPVAATATCPVKELATPAVAPPPRRRCVASPDSPSVTAQHQGQAQQRVPAGYVPLAQLEQERAERAALAAQLEQERAGRASLAAQLQQERAERAALVAQLEQERAERAALAEQLQKLRAERSAQELELQHRLEQETSRQAVLASQLGKEAAERASLASQLEQERSIFAARLQQERAECASRDAELEQLRAQCERMSQAAAVACGSKPAIISRAEDQEQQQQQQQQGEEDEKDVLMLCLGEQSRKVEVLAAALAAAGVDPAPLLASVEEAAAVW